MVKALFKYLFSYVNLPETGIQMKIQCNDVGDVPYSFKGCPLG